MFILLSADVYDSPSCWTIVPAGISSANICAAYGYKIYKIDHITSKDMVIASQYSVYGMLVFKKYMWLICYTV